jgi:hypothetical protein
LVAVSRGDEPSSNAERLTLAQRAYELKQYALAARLRRDAIESEPKLTEDRQKRHHYNAACAAALAAAQNTPTQPSPVEGEGKKDDADKTSAAAPRDVSSPLAALVSTQVPANDGSARFTGLLLASS